MFTNTMIDKIVKSERSPITTETSAIALAKVDVSVVNNSGPKIRHCNYEIVHLINEDDFKGGV